MIDTRGKTILPGLIDMHAHLELLGHGDYREYYEFLGDLDKLELSRTIAAKQLLRAGVTSAVDLGSTYGMLETRDRINNGEIPGPRITASGPWIARLPVDIVPKEMQLVVSSTSEARTKTIELIERGVDVIKAWEGLTRGDYEPLSRKPTNAAAKCMPTYTIPKRFALRSMLEWTYFNIWVPTRMHPSTMI